MTALTFHPLADLFPLIEGLAAIGRFATGRVAEVFLSTHKSNSAADIAAHDAAITFSIAVQHSLLIRVDGLDIIPIDNSADLYREGAVMHHCVGTYASDVNDGACYIYSIRRDGERLATAAVIRKQDRPVLQQIRGPCNVEVSGEIKTIARRWLRSNSRTDEQNQAASTVGR